MSLEGLGGDGRTILEWILKQININTRNWVDSGQDRGYWRALNNAALNHVVPQAIELINFNTLIFVNTNGFNVLAEWNVLGLRDTLPASFKEQDQ